MPAPRTCSGRAHLLKVISDPSDLAQVRAALEGAGVEIQSSDIAMEPSNLVEIDESSAGSLLRLLDEARERECRGWDDLQRLLGESMAKGPQPRRPSAMPRPVDKDTTA